MRCVILCAGYGTRLYPLTKDRPKSLLPVGGIPLLQRIVERVVECPDLNGIHVVSNRRFAGAFKTWAVEYTRMESLRTPIDVLDDGTTSNEDRLGAVGDLRFAIEQRDIREDLLILAGDNLLLFDLAGFCRFGRERGIATAVKDLKDVSRASLYGVVRLDRDGRVADFEEKPETPRSSLISIGVYYLTAPMLDRVGAYLDETGNRDQLGNFLQWLYPRDPVYGYVIRGQWFDIGDRESYERANRLFGTGAF